MMWNWREAVDFLKATFTAWSEHKAPRLGAALAYYSIFSIGPLVVIAVGVAGMVLGAEGVQGQVNEALAETLGPEGAAAVGTMVESQARSQAGLVATVLGVATLLLGASGLFGQLKDALNTIWEVAPGPSRGLLGTVKDKAMAMTMVLGVGFLLLISLVLSTALTAVSAYMSDWLPGGGGVWQGVNMAVSFGVITLLFAGMYKYLPDVKIRWRDVWVGAATTALLFTLGKEALSLYLAYAAPGSAYGAAGSLVVLLVWIYYSAQIFFFGAEMTQVYANRYGSGIEPARGAVPLTDRQRIQQGMPGKSKLPETRLRLGEPTGPIPPRRPPSQR